MSKIESIIVNERMALSEDDAMLVITTNEQIKVIASP